MTSSTFKVIRKSESTYYWMLKVGKRFHACIKLEGEKGDFGSYYSCQRFMYEEDFETVADSLAEEFRYMTGQGFNN
tara:strand:- start:1214 stop:1441 length:228 start_codon:yes stop_codon:yes gene_type:complete